MDELQKMLWGMSIFIRRAWDAKMPIGWKIPPRYIFDYELMYIKEGRVKIIVEDVEYDGSAGDLFFFTPGKLHSIKSVGRERVRQPHIHFDFYFDENSENLEIPVDMPCPCIYMREDITIKNVLMKLPVKMTFKSPYKVDNLIQNLIIEEGNSNPFGIMRKKALMFDLMYLIFNNRYIAKENNLGKGNALKIVQEANRYMQQNCDQTLTSEEVAKHVGYSTNYFVNLYKSICCISPVSYHEKLRIEKAKNFIVSTSLSMAEIADELGFDNPYSFSRYFKRITGISPTEYRNSVVSNKGENYEKTN